MNSVYYSDSFFVKINATSCSALQSPHLSLIKAKSKVYEMVANIPVFLAAAIGEGSQDDLISFG